MKEMSVTVLGSGGPIPTIERSGPAFALSAGEDISIVDCGSGTLRQMMIANLPVERSIRVFLTHLHSDHTLGLGQFVLGGWTLGRRSLRIFGPPGTEEMVELWFSRMLGWDVQYRAGLGRPSSGLTDIVVEECGAGPVMSEQGLRVTAADGIHATPDLAYRFDYGDRSVVFSGDTAPADSVAELAAGADVLFHESNLVSSVRDAYASQEGGLAVWESIQDHHSSPANAGEIAQKAGVRYLILVHFLPGADTNLAVEEASARFSGTVLAAEDLMRIEISEDISATQVM